MTNSIVFARDGQALTTSEAIAQGVGIQHKNILAVLRNYQADFETFGVFAFETRKPKSALGGRPETFALLNEQQATLLVTYCKNTATVRKFKVALVKAFYETKRELAREKLPHSARLDECNDYPLTEAQLVYIREFVKKHIPQGYRTRAYSELRRTFNVRRSAFIKIKNFDDAIGVLSAFAKRVPMLPPPKKHQRKTAQTLAMPKNIAPFRVLISFDECNKPYVQILGHKLLIDANNLEHLRVLVGQTIPVQYLAEVMQVCADRLARRI